MADALRTIRSEVPVEICLEGNDPETVFDATQQARDGGASRIELCQALSVGGLTPPSAHIRAARAAWGDGAGLVVLIRPRDGDFCCAPSEEREMARQIETAAEAGADSIAFGLLDQAGYISEAPTQRLRDTGRRLGLTLTFHRAFDATTDRKAALEILIGLGFDRVLTSGVPWGQPGTALDGLTALQKTMAQASDRIEIILCGGITPEFLPRLLAARPLESRRISIHAHSGAQTDGVTNHAAVRALVQAQHPAIPSIEALSPGILP